MCFAEESVVDLRKQLSGDQVVEDSFYQQGPEKVTSFKKEMPLAPRVNGTNMTISLDAYQAHAAAAANHTPIANGPGHSSAPPTAH
ncbi:hypothetical protein BYT27DRAFT_7243738, partial [Phlegmacium glaucopus]